MLNHKDTKFELKNVIKFRLFEKFKKKWAAGVAARTFAIRVGTTATLTDAAVQTFTSALGTAAIDTCLVQAFYTVNTTGATANGTGLLQLTHVNTATGFATTASQTMVGTAASFNSGIQQQFLSMSLTPGVAEVVTVSQCFCEIVKPMNP